MTQFFDHKETRPQQEREKAFFAALAPAIERAQKTIPAWRGRLDGVNPASVTSREALAALPVTRKSDIMAAQAAAPPFGGYVSTEASIERVFVSPGPVFVPQGGESDPWNAARSLYAAGLRPGELVANTFGYHMTPGAFILETGLLALGCQVFAAGPQKADELIATLAALKPSAYCGVPDFLNILLDRSAEQGKAIGFTKALVSGAALPGDLRQRIEARGVSVAQCYATADLGVIAYESTAREGLIVSEDLLVEIVRPGTGEPLPEGEVGEVVVTNLSATYPLFRFATGDMSAVLEGPSPCGRTNMRIKGWMGRADQRTKVKGMFVDPAQIATLLHRHPEVSRARLVVSRDNHVDVMTLKIEGSADAGAVAQTLKAVTSLSGAVEAVAAGSLPNDGKVIADERPVDG